MSERTPLLSPPTIDAEALGHEERAVASEVGNVSKVTPSASHSSVTFTISLLLLGVFVANAEGSIVLAAYGRIASDFNDLDNASWLVTSYVLAVSVTQPMYGKLSDIFGRTRMMLVAYTIFAVGCAICGTGQSLLGVIIGRVVAGVGGGAMTSLVSIIITDMVPHREIASWRSYVGVVATAGRASGGPIGGYLTDTIGWRWSFLGQVPPIALAFLLIWLLIPNRRSPGTDSIARSLSRIDFAGSFLLASTILLFLLPLEVAGKHVPWTHPMIPSLFIASLLVLALFMAVEIRWAREPLMPVRLLLSRNVLVPNTVMFCQAAAQLGMMYTVPIYFQLASGVSSAVAGAHLLPAVVGVTVGGLFGGFVTTRSTCYRTILLIATACSSTSYLLLVLHWGTSPTFWESLYIIPGGFGNGLVLSVSFVVLTAKISPSDMASVCSSFYMTGNIGTAVGLATTSAITKELLRRGLHRQLAGYPDEDAIFDGATASIDFIFSLDEPVKKAVIRAYVNSLKFAHMGNLAFAMVAFLTSLLV
ncbi:MFS general substrate transporter [Melanomma pulvis-pyrius CBS 109.77]|uniref:MFS general substrate transporter n=1 Tax=Melanomma pulvis-pyrius CBS 109.77 TaxID=1314802 RepID=A0A6A6XNF8_9PLEO|nr:MFS general substrate transporter [Melanomma pulvis-pyrius CBS 109.77]